MKRQIVLIDDDPSVLDSLQRTLRSQRGAWEVATFDCPQRAWEHLCIGGADTVVSDLRMPGIDGLQLLAWMQRTEVTKDIPFVILTGEGDRSLRRKALELGATDLLNKPVDPDDLIARIRSALRLKSFQDELKQHNATLENKVFERTRELGQSRLEVVWRLAKAAEFRDEATGNHVLRVASYSRAIGEALGLNGEFIETLFLTSPLHDIGKIGIPDSILLKPGKLTDSEWTIMRRHCAIGAGILRDDSRASVMFHNWRGGSAFAGAEDPLLGMASRIALTHHEKWDGSGYPQGLAGDDIPLESRIVALADVYDALTSNRPYKTAFSHEESQAIIQEGSGSHFDPQVYAAFVTTVDEFHAIRSSLSDCNELALVTEAPHEACAVCR